MNKSLVSKLGLSIAFVLIALTVSACVAVTDPAPAQESPVTPDAAGYTADVAADNVRKLLGKQLQIDPGDIEIVSAETVEWQDSCLELGTLVESCAVAPAPGVRVALRAEGAEYVFHTDRDGYRSRLASGPEPRVGDTVLEWSGTFDNGECMEARIGTDGVAFGLCGGSPRIGGHFVSDARTGVLAGWAQKYASFDAQTDYGSVRLNGSGSAIATQEEQEQIGRWAGMVAREAAAGERMAGLGYWGPDEMGSPDTSKCALLQVNYSPEAGIGLCDGTMRSEAMGERMSETWQAFGDRLAPFAYETETERIDFEGLGVEGAEPWQRALLAWARGRYAELSTGRTSATINTAMSWHLGQDFTQKNVCRHLTVLDYGYAYAEEILCEGQDPVSVVEGWLTTEELAALDGWLYTRAPLYVGDNYIDGKGEEEMSETEVAEVEPWASAVWSRLREGAEPTAAVSDNACPETREGLGMVRDYEKGFCLLAPPTHTVFEPNPDEIVLAQESLLNVTEPRVYITVTDAAGRTADAAADEVAAAFPGFEIERRVEQIAGHPATVLDNLPGQDLNRRVLIVANDRLYVLMFAPLDHEGMEQFYATILGDLTLIQPE